MTPSFLSGISAALVPASERHEEYREQAGGDEKQERPAPARRLRHPSDDPVGEDERTEEVAEETPAEITEEAPAKDSAEEYEEYEEYVCTARLDQDEMERFLTHKTRSCPYYRFYDEYKSVHKQI